MSKPTLWWKVRCWWAKRHWLIIRDKKRFVYLNLNPKCGAPRVVWRLGQLPKLIYE